MGREKGDFFRQKIEDTPLKRYDIWAKVTTGYGYKLVYSLSIRDIFDDVTWPI